MSSDSTDKKRKGYVPTPPLGPDLRHITPERAEFKIGC